MADARADVKIVPADLPPGYDLAKMMFYAEKHPRPWGHFKFLDVGPGFAAKALLVKGGQRTSLQRHAKRSETWTVAMGRLTVAIGGRKFDLGPGDSAFVPVGAEHRISNVGVEPAVLIEVQIGACDEADIVRLEDDYGRTAPAEGGMITKPVNALIGEDGCALVVPLRESRLEDIRRKGKTT